MTSSVPTLAGITAKKITTERLTTRVLFSGDEDGIPVIFVHGNVSSATFWEETMLALPTGYRGIAVDNRGYGDADYEATIDATRGMGDCADDIHALLDHLSIDKAHFVGHSLGGSILWRFMMDYPERILSLTQVAPGSPYGFGGTKDLDGTPCYDDFAGSGAGVVSADFAKAIADDDRGDSPTSPRTIINTFYWKPPFVTERIEDILSSALSIHTGEGRYPGDIVPSTNWPLVSPGVSGPNNAISPKYAGDISKLYAIDPKPPVLWIRGAEDQIVSDNSMFDVGTLGKAGAIPGYPGEVVFPPQPMIGQTRVVLEKYAEAGGSFEEVVFENCGHSPYIEMPDEFNKQFHKHIGG